MLTVDKGVYSTVPLKYSAYCVMNGQYLWGGPWSPILLWIYKCTNGHGFMLAQGHWNVNRSYGTRRYIVQQCNQLLVLWWFECEYESYWAKIIQIAFLQRKIVKMSSAKDPSTVPPQHKEGNRRTCACIFDEPVTVTVTFSAVVYLVRRHSAWMLCW